MNDTTFKLTKKNLPNSRLSVEVEVPSTKCKSSYESALAQLSRSVKLPGFRKGKVPKAVLLQQIGSERVKASAIESLLQIAWEEVLKEDSIEPLSEPELQGDFADLIQNFAIEKNLSITLETDIPPTPSLKNTTGLQVETEKVEFNPKKVDEILEDSRKQLATLVPVENRSAKANDIAVVSFKGTYVDDQSEIQGGSSESMEIELEGKKMIPGFIEGIIGMEINSQKLVECQFPKDYPQEESRDRKAKFDITLKDLKQRELPKLDDNFAQQASDKKTLGELRESLEKQLKDEANELQIKNRKDSLVSALVAQLEVEIPKTLIDNEVRKIIEITAQKFAQQGLDVKSLFTDDLVKSLMDSSRQEAEENVRRDLAIQALAKAEKIEVSEEETEKKTNEIKNEIGDKQKIDLKKLRQIVIDDLTEEKVYEWLEKNNTVVVRQAKGKDKSTKNNSDKKKPKK